jgi:HEAT repeat protein
MVAQVSDTDAAALRAALHDPDADVRRRAARALDHLPLDNATVAALVDLIRVERIPKVRGAAVHVLACEGCKTEVCPLEFDVVGLLIELLRDDPSAEVRRQTIDGLRVANHEPRVQEAIRAALNDPSRKVRGKAVYLLPRDERRVRGLP